jgi:hypothetical protein
MVAINIPECGGWIILLVAASTGHGVGKEVNSTKDIG